MGIFLVIEEKMKKKNQLHKILHSLAVDTYQVILCLHHCFAYISIVFKSLILTMCRKVRVWSGLHPSIIYL